jgi:hypothetical protein
MSFRRFILMQFMALLVTSACGVSPDTEEDEQAVTTHYGVDYSFSRPSPATIKAQGYTFVSRYLSYGSSKDLTKSEADALKAAGLDIVCNWEESATAALNGYSQGAADARAAQTEAVAAGMPATRPIYFSIDFDATPGQQTAINAYFDGVASVLGRSRTGAYGGYYPVQRLFNAGKIAWAWQTYAWSGGQWESRAQVRQIENGIDNDQEDKDESVATDFGQWGPGTTVETGPPPPPPPVPTACGQIDPGHGLSRGQSWHSCDYRFELAMQTDGNLVVYSDGVATWSTGTNAANGDVVVMQTDGNFVLYDNHSHPLFASGSNGHAGSHLAIQDDGNMVVYSGTHALWASNTGGVPTEPTACGAIEANHGLTVGEGIASCNGEFTFILQSDGNLVLYRDQTALWASHTVSSDTRRLVMQGDGNLVSYTQAGKAVWNSKTNGHSGARLAVQDDGNVVIYVGSTAIWATGTEQH